MLDKHRVTAVVMAAGQGTRMRSDLPKVLHRAGGRPLLVHVLAALQPLQLERRVIVGSGRIEELRRAVAESGFDEGIEYVVQDPPRGTADAVRTAIESIEPRGSVLVLPGDGPLIETDTLQALLHIQATKAPAATILTARMSDPTGYGRIKRDRDGAIAGVVEERDASYEERAIDEVNAGAYVFDVPKLGRVLGKVDRENAQHEYYLTDVVDLLRREGDAVLGYQAPAEQVLGVNSRSQLARVAQLLARRTCERWMDEGVTILDPATTFIDATVTIERDAVIRPFTFLEGDTRIGARADVGPQARIVDSKIGEGAVVSFAVVVSSVVGDAASVGPFASLRPGTRLERGARAGTFVETKQTTIGENSKANHLAYLGDAEIGRGVNVGAGTITCNWDGKAKHETVIEDDAYIGSDTMLVAPAHIGKRAATGAGSVVRGEVPDDALAVGVPARILQGRGDRMGARERADAPEAATAPEAPEAAAGDAGE